MSDIDYNYIHNRKCQLLEELKQVDNDEEMFEEFIRTALQDIAVHTRDQMKKTHSRNRFVRPKGHENCKASNPWSEAKTDTSRMFLSVDRLISL